MSIIQKVIIQNNAYVKFPLTAPSLVSVARYVCCMFVWSLI